MLFHELRRDVPDETQQAFYGRILAVMAQLGGGQAECSLNLFKRNSRRSRRENGLFFTSLLISIVAFYIILSLSHQDVMVFLQRMESDAVNRLLSLVPVLYGLTLFILFFLVYYANRFQLARRRHEFGVYLMLGMQRRKLFGMLLAEDLRSSLIALAIGLPAAVLISEVISLVTARLVGLGIVGHRFALSLSAIGWTAVGFLAIKLLASLILSGKIVRQEIGALLTETPEGTKRQRPAAVYAAALVLGAALLAGAYTFAILGYAWSGLRLWRARSRSAWRAHCCCFTGCASSSTGWPGAVAQAGCGCLTSGRSRKRSSTAPARWQSVRC